MQTDRQADTHTPTPTPTHTHTHTHQDSTIISQHYPLIFKDGQPY